MKPKKNKGSLLPPERTQRSPLKPAQTNGRVTTEQPAMVVVRTERRSWMALAITGFGALLLRYFKTVRERGQTVRRAKSENRKQKAEI